MALLLLGGIVFGVLYGIYNSDKELIEIEVYENHHHYE